MRGSLRRMDLLEKVEGMGVICLDWGWDGDGDGGVRGGWFVVVGGC